MPFASTLGQANFYFLLWRLFFFVGLWTISACRMPTAPPSEVIQDASLQKEIKVTPPERFIRETPARITQKTIIPPKIILNHTHTIQRGDTLAQVLYSFHIKPHRLRIEIRDELADFINLRKIKPGHKINVQLHKNGRLRRLRYFKTRSMNGKSIFVGKMSLVMEIMEKKQKEGST